MLGFFVMDLARFLGEAVADILAVFLDPAAQALSSRRASAMVVWVRCPSSGERLADERLAIAGAISAFSTEPLPQIGQLTSPAATCAS